MLKKWKFFFVLSFWKSLEPINPDGFKATGQNETSITLQWNKVKDISNYKLTYEKGSKEVTSTDATISSTIDDLTSGSRYNITLFSMRGEEISEGTSITAVTGEILFDQRLATSQT